ncbi:hypothetical protein ACFV3R_25340 [Streptomyces sp. NPDC059740]|uniref:hypothetical protein n=1 Tax=Streptomyces sp. NPDC059740 TaxID=3346926 RepID=UPI00365E31E1
MAKLARATWVRDPERHRDILLRAGEEPAPRYAALVTNPACWEGGVLPGVATAAQEEPSSDSAPEQSGAEEGDKPVARPAARKPARGRKSVADEGAGD